MTEQELKNEIKLEKFRKVYFICGEDAYLKNYYASFIAEKSAPVMPDMNLVRLDGKNVKLQRIFDETEQLPCMAEHRCVMLTDYNFAAAPAAEQDEFIGIVRDLPDSTVLIILADRLEIAEKKPGKWSKLITECEKSGCVFRLDHYPVPKLCDMMIKAAARREVLMDMTAARHMVEICGCELAKLRGEIEKLCAFKKDGRITPEDIDKICSKSVDANKYQLSQHILRGNVPASLKMIDDLFDMRLDEIEIFTLISGGFIDLYRTKMMIISKKTPAEAAEDFGYGKRKFVLENLTRTANAVSLERLRECIQILTDTDIKLKSTSDDKRFLLEQTVLKLIRTIA